MARRIIEEDTTTAPNTTYVEGDGSWMGRMIVALVVIALLVLGAVWLFNNVGDNGGTRDDAPIIQDNDNVDVPNPQQPEPNPVSS